MALANNVGMLADIQSFTDIMIGNQNPNTAVPKVANNLFDIGNRDRIDSSKGLVEQNKLWIRRQCAGNFNSSSLTAGQAHALAFRQMRNVKLAHQFFGSLNTLLAVELFTGF